MSPGEQQISVLMLLVAYILFDFFFLIFHLPDLSIFRNFLFVKCVIVIYSKEKGKKVQNNLSLQET